MKKLDPIYWCIYFILKPFFKSGLKDEELAFINDNIKKHRRVFWITLVLGIITGYGLYTFDGDITPLITALIAPVMIMGGAWFAITFGGIPVKLIDTAMSITFWMFTAFMVSLTTMTLAVIMISPPVIWPALAIIYIGIAIGCIQYDCADGLKAGLDESVLKHSRAAIKYYQRQGIHPEDE